jgi:predicted RNase H-like HicB family nuclease
MAQARIKACFVGAYTLESSRLDAYLRYDSTDLRGADGTLQRMSRMRQYIAVIHKKPDSDYGISFPDIPGVISAGNTPDEARDIGAEVLAFHLEGLAADGVGPPEPSSLEEIMTDAENRDGVVVLVAG